MEIKCPNPDCLRLINLPEFTPSEQGGSGRDIICPHCNGRSWIPVNGKPRFFPEATDQNGQLRLKKAATI
jgi:hypothetical protein